jgi:hypothetical protein
MMLLAPVPSSGDPKRELYLLRAENNDSYIAAINKPDGVGGGQAVLQNAATPLTSGVTMVRSGAPTGKTAVSPPSNNGSLQQLGKGGQQQSAANGKSTTDGGIQQVLPNSGSIPSSSSIPQVLANNSAKPNEAQKPAVNKSDPTPKTSGSVQEPQGAGGVAKPPSNSSSSNGSASTTQRTTLAANKSGQQLTTPTTKNSDPKSNKSSGLAATTTSARTSSSTSTGKPGSMSTTSAGKNMAATTPRGGAVTAATTAPITANPKLPQDYMDEEELKSIEEEAKEEKKEDKKGNRSVSSDYSGGPDMEIAMADAGMAMFETVSKSLMSDYALAPPEPEGAGGDNGGDGKITEATSEAENNHDQGHKEDPIEALELVTDDKVSHDKVSESERSDAAKVEGDQGSDYSDDALETATKRSKDSSKDKTKGKSEPEKKQYKGQKKEDKALKKHDKGEKKQKKGEKLHKKGEKESKSAEGNKTVTSTTGPHVIQTLQNTMTTVPGASRRHRW